MNIVSLACIEVSLFLFEKICSKLISLLVSREESTVEKCDNDNKRNEN